ncbi:MAG: tetratricopeptide repeat protein [Terracidiphilus sp.]
MLRSAPFVLLFALLSNPAISAQNPSSPSGAPPSSSTIPPQPSQPTAEPPPISTDVVAAEAAIAASDWKTAETRLDPYLAAHPTDARALFDAGYAADAQGRLDDAAALYRRAIASDPKSFEAHISLGLLLARQNKLAEARPELVAATNLDPGQADPALKARAWRALARIDRNSDPATASNELLQALKVTPETAPDTLLAAELAEKTGQDEAAAAAYHRVLSTDPGSAPATAGLAHLLILQKRYPDAETLLRAALAKNPDDPALTVQLANVLFEQDKPEALPLLQKLHDAHSGDATITRMLASVLADAGDYAGSDQLYIQLLGAAPGDPTLLVAHGQNLVRQARLDEAFAVFDKATQADAASVDAWTGLAFAASKTGRPDVTLHALTMRSRYLPDNASTLFLWATAYDSLHQKQLATDYYHRFLSASAGKFPNQEWQARQRLQALQK